MLQRTTLMNTACLLSDFFRKKAFMKKSFQELLDLQSATLNDKVGIANRELTLSYFCDFEWDVYPLKIGVLSAENGRFINKNHPKTSHVPSGWEKVRSIFMLDKSSLLMCLPLKTGTTNWQKTLASIMVHESSGSFLGKGFNRLVRIVYYLVSLCNTGETVNYFNVSVSFLTLFKIQILSIWFSTTCLDIMLISMALCSRQLETITIWMFPLVSRKA